MDRPIPQHELHDLRRAAEAAWDDDTRHTAHKGHPCKALGQCFVTAAWLQTLFGGHIARNDGHYLWLSPHKMYAVDLTGDRFITPPVHAHLEGVRLDADDEGVHLDAHHSTWRSGPAMHKKATDPLFAGWEVLPPVPSHERAALFVRRANRVLEAIRSGHRIAIDLGGDAFPGEQPQYLNDHGESFMHDDPFSAPEPKSYNVVYARGELHVSAEDSHDDLSRHALIEPNHTGPFAAGFVTVDPVGRANWQLRSNVGLHALMRVLKDYGKTVGWDWGGLTDSTGQPINDDFAPKKSLYYAFVRDELFLSKDPVTLRVASLEDDALYGRIDIHGTTARVDGLLDAPWTYEAIREWADDSGLRIVAGDNVIRRIEDLQQGNLWSPTNNDPEGGQFFNQPRRDDRSPGGVYKCPECHQIFPSYGLYIQHRQTEEPVADSSPDANDSGMKPLPEGGVSPGGEMSDFNGDHVAKVAVVRVSRTEWYGFTGGFKAGSLKVEDGILSEIEGPLHVTDALIHRAQRAFHSMAYLYDHTPWSTEQHERLAAHGFARTGKHMQRWSKDGDLSTELDGAVPFIFDVDKDKIVTGAPGGRHSDIVGKFTPAGIVEGLYEPGGKVIIRSITNMPYTVRHMLELWYYSFPQYVVKSVHLRDDAGQDTKLAHTTSADPEFDALMEEMARYAAEEADARSFDVEVPQVRLAVNGFDVLKHLAIKPGPVVATIIDRLTDEVTADPTLNDRDALLKKAEGYGLA